MRVMSRWHLLETEATDELYEVERLAQAKDPKAVPTSPMADGVVAQACHFGQFGLTTLGSRVPFAVLPLNSNFYFLAGKCFSTSCSSDLPVTHYLLGYLLSNPPIIDALLLTPLTISTKLLIVLK